MTTRVCQLSRQQFVAALFVVGTSCLLNTPVFGQAKPQPAQRKGTQVSTKENQPKKLTAAEIGSAVEQQLRRNTFYSPGFLITRSDAESVFRMLEEKGLELPDDREALYEDLLSDTSPLAKILKTPDGRAFMRKLVGDPTAYDRLERLSWTRDGRYVVDKMVRAKDGATRLKQLQTKDDVAKFSKTLATDPRTRDFALPTGRIHTAEALTERLTELLTERDAE
ncbi:hypothetical protein ETAA8_61940 [Anatilimnocola aggregata]|uniref:Uncharacterized protein n=1 Tax=Anatilimnocola aggregata TaxID=2528021 RepID=A0A517YLE1_9BACT|nr:hypothetical protein [Anatilimnocola aggregata]QDU31041.1 hypothetical protein ETAA8_61940 [Anatilimnocola aggregata]